MPCARNLAAAVLACHSVDPGRADPAIIALDCPMTTAARKQDFENNKLAKRLRRQVGQAIADFGMIEDGDKIMVCLSGGKDSHTLLDILLQLQARAPVRFELVAVNLDQKQPGFPAHVLPEYLGALGVEFTILEQDTYSIVKRVIPEGKTLCSLCSRLRRGALYTHAAAQGFTKIALGHHRDDIAATFLMNLFFHAKLASMPPKLLSDDGQHVVIRPLAYCRESDIARYAELRQFPIIPCSLCGSQENLQRKQVGRMLAEWERSAPGRVDQIVRALGDVRPSQLADRNLFDFSALGRRSQTPLPDTHAWLAGEPAGSTDTDDDASAPGVCIGLPDQADTGLSILQR